MRPDCDVPLQPSPPREMGAPPGRLEALLKIVVDMIRSAIETQAANAYWRARGVRLPDAFAEDAARNAAGSMVDLLAACDSDEAT